MYREGWGYSFLQCNNFLIIGKKLSSSCSKVFEYFVCSFPCLFGVLATFGCEDPNKRHPFLAFCLLLVVSILFI